MFPRPVLTPCKALLAVASLALFLTCIPIQPAGAQDSQLSMKDQRTRGLAMLKHIQRDIEENYFDPQYHGVDIRARFAKAQEEIKNAVSGDQIYGIIASALLDLEDSHTFFLPPVGRYSVQYGWDMQMIGDKCLVTSVTAHSDAERLGLKPGDEILSIFDIAPTRKNLWQLDYLFRSLRPVHSMRLVTRDPLGNRHELEPATKMTRETWDSIRNRVEQNPRSRQYIWDQGTELFVWKMPAFNLNDLGIERMMKRVRNHRAVLLDLRNNRGGYEESLLLLVAQFFDRPVTIGERKGRTEGKPIIAKSRGKGGFAGDLIVLVDSKTASAAEVFARIIQLEKRGRVLGDRTAGAVMESEHFLHDYVADSFSAFRYGVSVTINDIIMADGKSLESVGVTPDETVLPKGLDLSEGRDPILFRALEILRLSREAKNLNLTPFEP